MWPWEVIVVAVTGIASFSMSVIAGNYSDKAEQNLKEGVELRRNIILEPDKFTDAGLQYRRLFLRYVALSLLIFFGGVAIVLVFGHRTF